MPGDGKPDYRDERHLLLNTGPVTTEHSLQQSGRRLFQAARVRNRRASWAREAWKGWACMRDTGACRGAGQRSIPASFSQKWAVTVMTGQEAGVAAPMSDNAPFLSLNSSLQLVLLNGTTQCYPQTTGNAIPIPTFRLEGIAHVSFQTIAP